MRECARWRSIKKEVATKETVHGLRLSLQKKTGTRRSVDRRGIERDWEEGLLEEELKATSMAHWFVSRQPLSVVS